MEVTTTEKCPECPCEVAIDIPTAAHELLSYYKGKDGSMGDVIKLENAIRKCLVEELDVSSSKVL